MPLERSDTHNGYYPDYVVEVGRLCAAWSYLESITDRIVWGMLDLKPPVDSLITAHKDLPSRWSILVNHAQSHVEERELVTLRKINKALATVVADRNIIVHGQIIHKQTTKESFAVVTRGTRAGRWHLLTPKAVQIVIDNIEQLARTAEVIGEAHGWLHESLGGDIVANWPQRLESFS